jgi:hypothetical protein
MSGGFHPARALDRVGLRGAAGALRGANWALDALLPALRPDRAVRLSRLWLGERRGRSAYCVLDEDRLRATRRSDTVFIFGSGRSLTDIGANEWRRMSDADTVGFSHFHRQRWIRVDYHLVGEVPSIEGTAQSIRDNPLYSETIFGVMKGWSAEASNALVGRHLLPRDARIFRWRRVGRGRTLPPTTSLREGLVHGTNSALDVINFALVLGWRRIVIVGVDLYNKEYFWLPPAVRLPNEKPHLTAASRWPQADQVVDAVDLWREVAATDGKEIYVYDGRSLLANALPVFSW